MDPLINKLPTFSDNVIKQRMRKVIHDYAWAWEDLLTLSARQEPRDIARERQLEHNLKTFFESNTVQQVIERLAFNTETGKRYKEYLMGFKANFKLDSDEYILRSIFAYVVGGQIKLNPKLTEYFSTKRRKLDPMHESFNPLQAAQNVLLFNKIFPIIDGYLWPSTTRLLSPKDTFTMFNKLQDIFKDPKSCEFIKSFLLKSPAVKRYVMSGSAGYVEMTHDKDAEFVRLLCILDGSAVKHIIPPDIKTTLKIIIAARHKVLEKDRI